MNRKANNTLIPLAIIGILFFTVGFALGINSYIVPLLQESLGMSSAQSYLVIAATFAAFLVFSYPSTALIVKIGYRKTIILSFAVFAVGFLLFVPSARLESLPLFMLASFVCGTGNTMLQAAINPYATFLGPVESAARRISIMGICNILAWPASPIFLAWIIGKSLDEMTLADIVTPFYVIAGIFALLGLFILVSPLKDMEFPGEEEDCADTALTAGKTSIWQFPHFLLGALALFMYVGVETIAMASSVDFAASIGLDNPEKYALVPSLGMVMGYIAGVICIPKYMSQLTALKVHSVIAVAGTLAVVLLPEQIAVYAVFIVTFGCSIMYPAIWPLALEGLGRFTKAGSSILVACIAGGSIIPLAYGFLKDFAGPKNAYILGLGCFLIVLFYAFFGKTAGSKNKKS